MPKADNNKQYLIGVVLFFGFIVLLCIGGWLITPGNKAEKERLRVEKAQLLEDFRGTNETNRVAAFRVLIHDKKLWDESIRVLDESGDKELALAFCNDSVSLWGGGKLTSAGVRWAQSHGFRVSKRSKGYEIHYFFQ